MVQKSQDGSYDCLLVSPTLLLMCCTGDACKKGIDHSYQPLLDSPPITGGTEFDYYTGLLFYADYIIHSY